MKMEQRHVQMRGGRNGLPSFALQAQHVIGADVVVFAQRAQVAYRHFVELYFFTVIVIVAFLPLAVLTVIFALPGLMAFL